MMKLETQRVLGPGEIEEERQALLNKYDSLEALSQKVSIIGCTRPNYVDDYMVLKALSTKNPSLKERNVYTGSDIFMFLTPRRMDILDYLRNNKFESITTLARGLRRNYKNVYNDLEALEEAGLVALKRERNRKIPRLIVTEIKIVVDGGGERSTGEAQTK